MAFHFEHDRLTVADIDNASVLARTADDITGTVERLIDNDKVEVEIADNVKVEIVKATGIQGLLNNQEVKK